VWAGDCRSAVSGITNALAVFNNLFRTFGANETGDYVDPWLTANNIMQQAIAIAIGNRQSQSHATCDLGVHRLCIHHAACCMQARTSQPTSAWQGSSYMDMDHTTIVQRPARYTMQRPAWLATPCNGRLGSLHHENVDRTQRLRGRML
jgi:hypothetical protein